jgi:hypothetical protein
VEAGAGTGIGNDLADQVGRVDAFGVGIGDALDDLSFQPFLDVSTDRPHRNQFSFPGNTFQDREAKYRCRNKCQPGADGQRASRRGN